MSADVEIIEDDVQIIEISDEESDDLLVINNDSEDIVDENIVICESPGVPDQVCVNLPRNRDNFSKISILPSTNTNNKCQCMNSENKMTESDNKNQVISNSNPHKTSEVKIVEVITNSNSNKSVSSIAQGNKSPRKRKRKIQNTGGTINQHSKTLKTINASTAVQTDSNSSNRNDQNANACLPNLEEAASSSKVMTNVNKRCSENEDFSKLNWLKPLNNLSSPPHLQIVIIDRSHPQWRITSERWLMIEKRLLEALHSEMLQSGDTNIGLFDGAKWQRGIKVVGCHNKHAFDFILKFIMKLDNLWSGAKLDAFPVSLICRHTVKVYVPPPTLHIDLVMSLIKLQNPSITCTDWKVIRQSKRVNTGGVDIWISINTESYTQICNKRGEIKYGINRIWMKPSQ